VAAITSKTSSFPVALPKIEMLFCFVLLRPIFRLGYTCKQWTDYQNARHCRFCHTKLDAKNTAPNPPSAALKDVCTQKEWFVHFPFCFQKEWLAHFLSRSVFFYCPIRVCVSFLWCCLGWIHYCLSFVCAPQQLQIFSYMPFSTFFFLRPDISIHMLVFNFPLRALVYVLPALSCLAAMHYVP
jgi:hypothetical protein